MTIIEMREQYRDIQNDLAQARQRGAQMANDRNIELDALQAQSNLIDDLAVRAALFEQDITARETELGGEASRQQSTITKAAREAAQAAYNAACNQLGIQSPSRVMKDVGKFFDEGFAEGIEDGMGRVMDSATNLSRMAAGGIQQTRSQANQIDYDRLGDSVADSFIRKGVGGTDLVVDGWKLGSTLEPKVSRAARNRSGQSATGRSARMVLV